MSLGLLLDSPYYSGTGVAPEVPGVFDIALDGRNYMLDTYDKAAPAWFRQPAWASIPLLRDQADTANLPGESSLNPAELWRRSSESWHHGAGQTYQDRPDSDPARFRSSKGIDCFTRWEMSLLPDTTQIVTSANTNLALETAGARWYYADGNSLKFKTDLAVAAGTTVTGTPAAAVTSIASDGFTVYAAHSGDNVWSTNTGTGAASTYTTGATLSATAVLGFVKGRLLLGDAGKLYNLVASGALPTALKDNGANFVWVGFAEGPANAYAAGFTGDKSLIYRLSIKSDGTGLDAPVVAGELPDGEVVRAIGGYLGALVIGTDLGVRYCQTDTAGNLQVGDLIPTGSAVRCFEPQDRFVWYGLTNYDTVSTGLGRLDLRTLPNPAVLAPAYATDLMATAQGAVASVRTFSGRRVFAVSGSGIWAQSVDKVATGTIDSGLVGFGVPDDKVVMHLDVRTKPLTGSVAGSLASDEGSFVLLNSVSAPGVIQDSFDAQQVRGTRMEARLDLSRSAIDTTAGPRLTHWSLRAFVAPPRSDQFIVGLKLREQDSNNEGQVYSLDPLAELIALRALVSERRAVTFQDSTVTRTVVAEDYQFFRDDPTADGLFWNGTCVMTLKSLT